MKIIIFSFVFIAFLIFRFDDYNRNNFESTLDLGLRLKKKVIISEVILQFSSFKSINGFIIWEEKCYIIINIVIKIGIAASEKIKRYIIAF